MKHDIFISYSRKDSNEVKGLKSRIEQHLPHLRIWFDEFGIDCGDEFEDKIVEAIDSCDVVLFMLSENSLQSKWTKKEVMYAQNTQKRVIPVLLRNAKLKGWFLFNFGPIDYIDSSIETSINKLLSHLAKTYPKPANTSTPPKGQPTGSDNKNTANKAQEIKDINFFGNQQEQPTSFNLILQAPGTEKLQVVKLVKELTGVGLKEAKEMVDSAPAMVKKGLLLEEAKGLQKLFKSIGAKAILLKDSDSNPKDFSKVEEITHYDLILKDGGASKLQVVKLVKEITGLGLRDAKEMVDSAPAMVKKGLLLEEGKGLQKLFESAGAKVYFSFSGNNFNVILKDPGKTKLLVVKLIKEYLGISLKEAKEKIDYIPSLIKGSVPLYEAERLKKQLEDAGAKVFIE